MPKDDSQYGNGVRFSIIGEKGAYGLPDAAARMENLQKAKVMFEQGKKKDIIKYATGWERAGDGKWRTEIPPLEIKTIKTLPDGNEYINEDLVFMDGKLEDYIDAPELFAAYPDLKNTGILMVDTGFPGGYYDYSNDRIMLNINTYFRDAESPKSQQVSLKQILIHEIQHAIQHREGFALGSNEEFFKKNPVIKRNQKKLIEQKIQEEYDARRKLDDFPELQADIQRFLRWDDSAEEISDNDFNDMGDLYDRLNEATNGLFEEFLHKRAERRFAQRQGKRDRMTPQQAYRATAGEVEARNAVTRSMLLDMDYRMRRPLDVTEDTQEEEKIYLSGSSMVSHLALFDNREKARKIISALQKIVNGSEEETVSGLRNDLAQYGGTDEITFYWGNEKKGIYHIAYRRGVDTLLHVIDAVADGKIKRFVAGNKTVVIEKDGFEAVLALTEYGKQKSWLLSGWQINKPDANGEVGAQSAATQLKPTFSRQELGAGLYKSISQIFENSNADGPLTDTAPFKKWFANSKVVDQHGNPLTVYHGTNWDGWAFDTANGAWFSEDEDYAGEMAGERGGDRIVKAYLAIQNPMVVKLPPAQMADPFFEQQFIRKAKAVGHDGIRFETDTDNNIQKFVFWVAFAPNQIKSVDNSGFFDSNNPDIRFSLADYSTDDQNDIVAILKPFVGRNAFGTAEEYASYLREHGVDIPEKDAFLFAKMAARQVSSEIAKRNAQKRKREIFDFAYASYPLFQQMVDIAGENFILRPSESFIREDFTGDFISPEVVALAKIKEKKYKTERGRKKAIEKAQEKLVSASGMASDEAASAIARQYGGDAIEIEQELIDFFRHLTRKDLASDWKKFKDEAAFARKEDERRTKEEFLQQEQFRIQEEVIDILERGQGITEEWIKENRKVFQELYRQLTQ